MLRNYRAILRKLVINTLLSYTNFDILLTVRLNIFILILTNLMH